MLRTPLGACNDNWGNGLPQPFRRLRNDEKGRERIAAHLTAVSPAARSVLLSFTEVSTDTRTAMTELQKRFSVFVIYWHILYFYTVKVSKGKFVPLVIRRSETQPIGFPVVLPLFLSVQK